jgi:hypothetical protein
MVRSLVDRVANLFALHSEKQENEAREDAGKKPALPRLFPDLDADSEHIHFEMTPLDGDSMLWLTLRRGITPERAAASLRKIADFIEREGTGVRALIEGREEPLRLAYNENGDIVVSEG